MSWLGGRIRWRSLAAAAPGAVLLVCVAPLPACTYVGTPSTDDPWVLIGLANQRLNSGREIGARTLLHAALPLARERGDRLAETRIHNDTCLTFAAGGDGSLEAEAACRHARSLAQRHGFDFELAQNEKNYALLWQVRGSRYAACSHAREAQRLLDGLRDSDGRAERGTGQRERALLAMQVERVEGSARCAEMPLIP